LDAEILKTVFRDKNPKRLDRFLTDQFPQFSRSRIQQLIRNGSVTIDNSLPIKSGQLVYPGQEVILEVPQPVPVDLVPEKIELKIIFENTDVLVIDKPAGMVVHPSAGHATGTLVNAILGQDGALPEINGEYRPGIVHRLDKDTSGLIMIAKNEASLRSLQDQFKSRNVQKIYLALVDGHPPSPMGRVEAPIGRDPGNRKKMAVVDPARGREAVTEYRTLDSLRDHTFLEVHPLTGRTHQIRVHMKFIHCPISGDTVYGQKKSSINIPRHFLHAARLRIILPGEEKPREFLSTLPDDLQAILESLRIHK
jgi:23S rRNA pseudouridine1911/1915/1917 synthase